VRSEAIAALSKRSPPTAGPGNPDTKSCGLGGPRTCYQTVTPRPLSFAAIRLFQHRPVAAESSSSPLFENPMTDSTHTSA
jgi:hypothetical protein